VLASVDCRALPGTEMVEGGGLDQVALVQERVDVSRKYFKVVSGGDVWPSEMAECRTG
jgi:hypothetical protein